MNNSGKNIAKEEALAVKVMESLRGQGQGDETGKKGKGVNYSTQLNLNGSSTVNREENKRELSCGDSLFSLDSFNGNTHLTFQSCTCEFFQPSSRMHEIKLLKSDKK